MDNITPDDGDYKRRITSVDFAFRYRSADETAGVHEKIRSVIIQTDRPWCNDYTAQAFISYVGKTHIQSESLALITIVVASTSLKLKYAEPVNYTGLAL